NKINAASRIRKIIRSTFCAFPMHKMDSILKSIFFDLICYPIVMCCVIRKIVVPGARVKIPYKNPVWFVRELPDGTVQDNVRFVQTIVVPEPVSYVMPIRLWPEMGDYDIKIRVFEAGEDRSM